MDRSIETNDEQPPGYNDTQLPDQNDLQPFEPTWEDLDFLVEGPLSITEGAQPGLGNDDPWTHASTGDQHGFSHNQQGVALPPQQWNHMPDGGAVSDYGQTPQQSFSDQVTRWEPPTMIPQMYWRNNDFQAADQQQANYFPRDHGTYPGSHSRDSAAPQPGLGYPELQSRQWHNNLYPPRAYHDPPAQEIQQPLPSAHTSPHIPAFAGAPVSVATDQEDIPASKGSSERPHRMRKRQDEEEEKEATKKSKADKGVETKERKKQDKLDRETLIRVRDEVASKAHEIASQYIPDGAERAAFEEQWALLEELNKEIDGNTEKYVTWVGMRPNLRKSDRAVPERKQED